MAVEKGHEDDAGFVEPRWRPEDVARQRNRRRQDGVELRKIAASQRRQRRCGRGRDGVEDAEQACE